MSNGLLNLFLVIVLFGLILWVVFTFIPMASSVKSLLNALVIIVLLLYVLQFFGIIKTIIPMIKLIH